MTTTRPLGERSLNVLRHLAIHGACTTKELRAQMPSLSAHTIKNMRSSCFISTDEHLAERRWIITGKGKEKVVELTLPSRKKQALMSSEEIQAAIANHLRYKKGGSTAVGIARAVGQPPKLLQPHLASLLLTNTLQTDNAKPCHYSLREQSSGKKKTRHVHTGHYAGTELRRNPGLSADRFAAYELPSRINDNLHWPDGRVERITSPAPMPS